METKQNINVDADKMLELFRYWCKRPAMYGMSSDSADTLFAFVEGFYYAQSFSMDEDCFGKLREFNRWLSEKFEMPKNWAWISILKNVYKDDKKVFEQLPILYEEFLNQNKKSKKEQE